jgi:metal-responsive CopG/Arc/MetJ family transcriptional regulator
MSPDLVEQVDRLAELDDRSRSYVVRQAVTEWIERHERQNPPAGHACHVPAPPASHRREEIR